jgi:hypothetical protein
MCGVGQTVRGGSKVCWKLRGCAATEVSLCAISLVQSTRLSLVSEECDSYQAG